MKTQLNIRTITIIICTLSVIDSAKAADWRYKACREPKNCGKGPNISYPFYVSGENNDYCGRKGFAITCEKQKPMYRTSRGPYIVENISYQDNSFRLVDADVANTTCVAPSHYFIFDIPRTITNFTPTHANIQFFYGCNKTFNPSFDISRTPCAPINYTHPSFVALIVNDDDLDSGIGCQKEVAVPIDLEENQVNHTIKNVNYAQLLRDGFTLKWNGGECDKCMKSGGICGSQGDNAVCLCHRGPELSVWRLQCTMKEGKIHQQEKRTHRGFTYLNPARRCNSSLVLLEKIIHWASMFFVPSQDFQQ